MRSWCVPILLVESRPQLPVAPPHQCVCTGGLPAGLDVLQSITRILQTPSNFTCFFTRSEQLAHDARWSERLGRRVPAQDGRGNGSAMSADREEVRRERLLKN